MNKFQIVLSLAFFASCFFTLTTSLNCYICDSALGANCSKPTTVETCNATLAQNTISYGFQYTNANFTQLNVSSPTYACVYDVVTTAANVSHYYLGCAYSNLNICNFSTKAIGGNRTCGTCSKDKCNYSSPADRSSANKFVLLGAIALAFIGAKFM